MWTQLFFIKNHTVISNTHYSKVMVSSALFKLNSPVSVFHMIPLDAGRKLKAHKTFRKRPGRPQKRLMYDQFASGKTQEDYNQPFILRHNKAFSSDLVNTSIVGIIHHMVLTQNSSKNGHFLLFHTHNYVCKSGFRNVSFSESFAHIRNEWPHWHEFIWFLKTNWPKDIDVTNTCQVNLKWKSSARLTPCPNSVGRVLSDMGLFQFSKSHDLMGMTWNLWAPLHLTVI